MKKIGILGGLGPEATADYYKEIVKGFNAIHACGDLTYPEMVIYSVTMSKFIGLLEENKYDDAAGYLAECIHHIQKAGADFAVISANTPHLLFHSIQEKVDLPLLSIVDACAQEANRLKRSHCLLLGTRFTMQSDFYQKSFEKYGIKITVPEEQDINHIHNKLFTELELGIFKDATLQELLAIVQAIKSREAIDAVILGCTEFPLLFPEKSYLNVPFLNTTKIHVDAIINQCLKG